MIPIIEKSMRAIAAISLVLMTTSLAAEVNHSEDLEVENCIVYSLVDSFAGEVTSVTLYCDNIPLDGKRITRLEHSVFKINYFPLKGYSDVLFLRLRLIG